mgnify:CR=1 FL=1
MVGSLQRLGVGYWRVLIAPVATGNEGYIRESFQAELVSRSTLNPLQTPCHAKVSL